MLGRGARPTDMVTFFLEYLKSGNFEMPDKTLMQKGLREGKHVKFLNLFDNILINFESTDMEVEIQLPLKMFPNSRFSPLICS